MDPLTEVVLGFLLIPVAGFAYGFIQEWRRDRPQSEQVMAVDDPAFGGMPTMHSERWGLSGRPDELRRLPDGTIIPVEIKSCRSPRSGVPYPSHRVQLLIYCALVEETYGRAPPYGTLCYGDGREVRVAWDADSRAELRRAAEAWSAATGPLGWSGPPRAAWRADSRT